MKISEYPDQDLSRSPELAPVNVDPVVMRRETINWNDTVILKPTAEGWRIWDNYLHQLKADSSRFQRGDTLTLTLWEAASVFGPKLYNGCLMPFETATMDYKSCSA